jgi:hypothetical protein
VHATTINLTRFGPVKKSFKIVIFLLTTEAASVIIPAS